MSRSTYTAVLAALAAAALFGASAPLAKLLLGSTASIPLAALLYLGSGLSAGLFRLLLRPAAPNGRVESRLERGDLPWLMGAVLAGGVAGPILQLTGLKTTPAATAALLLNFESAATALLAVLFFKEAVGRRAGWSVALVTAASILLSWNTAGGWGFSLGALSILGACAFWGLDNNFTRHISAKDPLAIVQYKGLGAGLFSLGLAAALGQPLPGLKDIIFGLLLGAFSYGLSITLFILAMRGLGAARTSALFASAPFAGAALAFIVLGERPAGLFLPAALLMGLAAWLLVGENHTHEHAHPSLAHDHRHCHDDGHHTHSHPDGIACGEGEHAHPHLHTPLVHTHPHLPDLHHRHEHQPG